MDAVKGYRKPNHGLFPFIPDAWVPYAELMRLDRQSGFWAFYWHYLIGLGFAINLRPFSDDIDLKSLAVLAAYLGLWATVFRGITCGSLPTETYSARRRQTSQAHFFTAALVAAALVAAGTCILWPYGYSLLFHAAIDSLFLFIYPLLKRFPNFPQVELGFGLSYAIFLVTAMLAKDPLARRSPA